MSSAHAPNICVLVDCTHGSWTIHKTVSQQACNFASPMHPVERCYALDQGLYTCRFIPCREARLVAPFQTCGSLSGSHSSCYSETILLFLLCSPSVTYHGMVAYHLFTATFLIGRFQSHHLWCSDSTNC